MSLFLPSTRFLRSTLLGMGAAAVFAGGIFWGGEKTGDFVNGVLPALIRIAPERAPRIAMTAQPMLAENKGLLLAYEASDDAGVSEVALRLKLRHPLPGDNPAADEISLPVEASRRISRRDAHDLTSHPWAGQDVTLQLVATNERGKKSVTEPVDFTLPERRFFHPIARVLIEERKKLMLHPEDRVLREKTATTMANIAYKPFNYRGDPVVLMALRTGAVRLVLEDDLEAARSVNDLLWKAASRIEDSTVAILQSAM